MTPKSNGRHCDKCDVTLLDFSVLTDAQIIETLKKSGPVCVRATESQLHRPLIDASYRNAPTLNLKAVAMGASLLMTIPALSQEQSEVYPEIDLISSIEKEGEPDKSTESQAAKKVSIVALNARSGNPASDIELMFLSKDRQVKFSATTNDDGVALVSKNKLAKKEIAYIEVETTDQIQGLIIPYKGDEMDIVIKIEYNYQEFMVIGMVEHENLRY